MKEHSLKEMLSQTLLARKEKSMPGCKAPQDRLTDLLGDNVAGDLKLKPVLIYHSKTSRALKNYANLFCLCSINGRASLDNSTYVYHRMY